jgi:hypothetical protein
MIFECPGSEKIRKPVPENIKCPRCGAEEEIWSDEICVPCGSCGSKLSRSMGSTCLDWCKAAAGCVGIEKYNDYKSVSN